MCNIFFDYVLFISFWILESKLNSKSRIFDPVDNEPIFVLPQEPSVAGMV